MTNQWTDERTHKYGMFLVNIKNEFNKKVSRRSNLFTTDVTGLYELYLKHIPEEQRQIYTCRTCKNFIEKFGGLVMINEDGYMESAIWNIEVPEFFRQSVEAMNVAVLSSKVTGVFYSDELTLGTPNTGVWNHLYVSIPSSMMKPQSYKTATQLMAEKHEEYNMLNRALSEFPISIVNEVISLLTTGDLYRADNCISVAEWFKQLHDSRLETNNKKHKENLTWLTVATAPTGFCHIKSGMIGTLLEDVKSGLSYRATKARFEEKMNPLSYMRSQSEPTVNMILEAEKTIEKYGLAESLNRRYAKFHDIPKFIWLPKKDAIPCLVDSSKIRGGVFGHLIPEEPCNVSTRDIPVSVMTWEKFNKTVLPTVQSIEVKVENADRFMALVTAQNKNARNILKWDNPFSWYYHGGIDGEIKDRVEQAGGQYENNEIRCSLIWDGVTDLDLHCKTPRMEHIYYSNHRSRCGGWLDIDMNGGSHRCSKPIENIRWSTGKAPEGNYRFYVENFAERINDRGTSYKVELEVNGQVFTYYGDALRDSAQQIVFEFNYVKGQIPNIRSNQSISNSYWGLKESTFVKVNGITTSPNLWCEENHTNFGQHIFFLLEGCRDDSEGKGRGFLNEMLKSELHPIRKTLEAYTKNTPISGLDESTACGLGYTYDREWNLVLRVKSNNSTRIIKIDRWD